MCVGRMTNCVAVPTKNNTQINAAIGLRFELATSIYGNVHACYNGQRVNGFWLSFSLSKLNRQFIESVDRYGQTQMEQWTDRERENEMRKIENNVEREPQRPLGGVKPNRQKMMRALPWVRAHFFVSAGCCSKK